MWKQSFKDCFTDFVFNMVDIFQPCATRLSFIESIKDSPRSKIYLGNQRGKEKQLCQ